MIFIIFEGNCSRLVCHQGRVGAFVKLWVMIFITLWRQAGLPSWELCVMIFITLLRQAVMNIITHHLTKAPTLSWWQTSLPSKGNEYHYSQPDNPRLSLEGHQGRVGTFAKLLFFHNSVNNICWLFATLLFIWIFLTVFMSTSSVLLGEFWCLNRARNWNTNLIKTQCEFVQVVHNTTVHIQTNKERSVTHTHTHICHGTCYK